MDVHIIEGIENFNVDQIVDEVFDILKKKEPTVANSKIARLKLPDLDWSDAAFPDTEDAIEELRRAAGTYVEKTKKSLSAHGTVMLSSLLEIIAAGCFEGREGRETFGGLQSLGKFVAYGGTYNNNWGTLVIDSERLRTLVKEITMGAKYQIPLSAFEAILLPHQVVEVLREKLPDCLGKQLIKSYEEMTESLK